VGLHVLDVRRDYLTGRCPRRQADAAAPKLGRFELPQFLLGDLQRIRPQTPAAFLGTLVPLNMEISVTLDQTGHVSASAVVRVLDQERFRG